MGRNPGRGKMTCPHAMIVYKKLPFALVWLTVILKSKHVILECLGSIR
jgi:hypothetical protein